MTVDDADLDDYDGPWMPSTARSKKDNLVHIVFRNYGVRIELQCNAGPVTKRRGDAALETKWESSKLFDVYRNARPRVPTCLWCVASGRGY